MLKCLVCQICRSSIDSSKPFCNTFCTTEHFIAHFSRKFIAFLEMFYKIAEYQCHYLFTTLNPIKFKASGIVAPVNIIILQSTRSRPLRRNLPENDHTTSKMTTKSTILLGWLCWSLSDVINLRHLRFRVSHQCILMLPWKLLSFQKYTIMGCETHKRTGAMLSITSQVLKYLLVVNQPFSYQGKMYQLRLQLFILQLIYFRETEYNCTHLRSLLSGLKLRPSCLYCCQYSSHFCSSILTFDVYIVAFRKRHLQDVFTLQKLAIYRSYLVHLHFIQHNTPHSRYRHSITYIRRQRFGMPGMDNF